MIKEVTEIPKPNCQPRGTYPIGYFRQEIRKDIKYGFEQKIPIFELIGYEEAKPDYIAQAARDEAYLVCKELVYDPAKAYVKKKLAKEFGDKNLVKCITPLKYAPNYIIKIRGITLEDGIKHVYCEINFKTAKAFKKQLLEDSRKRTQDALDEEKRKRRYK